MIYAFFMKFFTARKFSNKKTVIDGIKFDSLLESSVYLMYKAILDCKGIREIIFQPKVYLTAAKILYKPDFKIIKNDGSYYYAEAKGAVTAVFAIKKRLWQHYGDGDLLIYKGSAKKFHLVETVKKKG